MPIYSVTITATYTTEVEAKDEDLAGEKAIEIINDDPSYLIQNAETDIELSDNQYTDQQELLDRERESEL